MNRRSKQSRFSIKTLFVLPAISAGLVWDLQRQHANDQAFERFESVFPGSFLALEQPTGLRQLQSLNLTNCPKVDDALVEVIRSLPGLAQLELTGTQVEAKLPDHLQ